MVRLNEIEKVLRPNFIFERTPNKIMHTLEQYEGNKEIARDIFIGIAEMYGFDSHDVMNYLEVGYNEYRSRLLQFRKNYRLSMGDNCPEELIRFRNKTRLVLNTIRTRHGGNPYLRIEHFVSE
jgi:hypothetical protein